MTRAEKLQARKVSQARIAESQAEALTIYQKGICPQCGSGIRRNNALAGWIQCEQFGAVGWRKDSTKPDCSYQGFFA